MSTIAENVRQIKARIDAASGERVKLIAVSKTVPPERIREAYEAGLRIFGENRIQEAVPKLSALTMLPMEWHFVGHLQTNKARDAVLYFSVIHSIDSVRLMQHVEKEAAKLKKRIDLLLEVNLGGEETKYGLHENGLAEALEAGTQLQWGRVCGLMIVPPYFEDVEQVRPFFKRLRDLRDKWSTQYGALTELSMGMSHDYEVAIQEGATMIRIGTAIFGEREKKPPRHKDTKNHE